MVSDFANDLIAKSKARKVDMAHCIVCDCDITSTCEEPPGEQHPGVDFFTIIVPYQPVPMGCEVSAGRFRRACAKCFHENPEVQEMWLG